MEETEGGAAIGEHLAQVTPRGADNALLAVVRERTPGVDDDFLAEHEPYFWEAEISSTRLDSYCTHMDKTSLRNYAEDAKNGVPFMNSHRTGGLFSGAAELPLGRSLDAKFNAGQKTGEPSTQATFYTFRGLRLGEVTTDDFINGVRAGIVRDVSIGFLRTAQTKYICDICDEDMFRSETCFHFPGMSYEVGEGKSKRQVVCTVRVVDARLAEVSAVYKGSTPGAMITKANRLAEASALPPQTLHFLQDQYRILLPGTTRTYTWNATNASAQPPPAPETETEVKDTEMGERENPAPEPTVNDLAVTDIRALLSLKDTDNPLTEVRKLKNERDDLLAELEGLRAQAADGKAYRDDLVAQVVTEGKRAFGEGFNEEAQTKLFSTAPIDTLKATRDAYKGVADKLFPAGRVTKDDDGEGEEAPPAPRRPARTRRAYAA